MKRIICALFAVIGLLCIIFPEKITVVLPYVLGGVMIVAGLVYGITPLNNRGVWTAHSAELATGFVLLAVGIVCIFHGEEFIGPMGIVWAIIGIRKASKSLSRTIQAFGMNVACFAAFIEFLVRLTLSFMLLLYPVEKFEGHIVLLGLELIVISLRPAKRLSLIFDEDE